MKKWFAVLIGLAAALHLNAQDISKIIFCDKKYDYGIGHDSITLFLKVLDSDGNRSKEITSTDLEKYLVIYEDDSKLIPSDRRTIESLSSGSRIPSDYTFSVLVDLSIPENGKTQIYEAVERLVGMAPDSCVYLSFFGDEVTSSLLVTKQNYASLRPQFLHLATNKYFYSALYAKLSEFGGGNAELDDYIKKQAGYTSNTAIKKRANSNKDKNLLFVFTEGNIRPTDESKITFLEVTEYQGNNSHVVPKVYAFYYIGDGIDENVELTLQGVTSPRDVVGNIISERKGAYKPSEDLSKVLQDFEQVVQDAMYDFSFRYQIEEGQYYAGRTEYKAEWKGEIKGDVVYSIGTPENPWPTSSLKGSTGNRIVKLLVAFAVTFFTCLFFFMIIKILVPGVKSKLFTLKYYKKYKPEENVHRKICNYCKQEIRPDEIVVVKCKHIMHVHCWQQNDYKCAEYGQNCKTGIQDHIDWKELLTLHSLMDSLQTFAGIGVGLVCWIIYELMGRGGFTFLARIIVNAFFTNEEQYFNLFDTCVSKVSAFLTIGLLLGFFLSIIFRYGDEYRKKDWRVFLKIIGLSLVSALIGMTAFIVGAIIFCILLSVIGTTYIPWYCSLPAYLLFSVSISLSLTIKSSIPLKSATIGGVLSSIIGFFVLYYSSVSNSRFEWMNMLLDFVIYGGGLGASLVTVRMLAEKYFLVIQNGIKADQRIPIHKWMNATGGGNKVSLGMTGDCEIQMNWEKSNKVAKEHAQLYIDHTKNLPVLKPLATGVVFNTRAELPVGKPIVLSNGDTFKIGDTIFKYVETD